MRDRTTLVDPERLEERLVELVRIPSVTGDEEAATRRLADWVSESGAEVDYWYDGMGKLLSDPAYGGHEAERAWVPVVAGIVRGARPGPTVMLTGHVDVVPPGDYSQWESDPFRGAIEDDTVYGRGAADMKGGLVSALEAFEAFARGPRDFAGRVVFVAVPAEEDSGLGTLAAIRRGWTADAVVIPEPTWEGDAPQVVVAHAGAMSCVVEIPGRSAHASKRFLGESALDHYVTVHAAIREMEQELNDAEEHPLLRDLTLPYATNVGLVHGGSWSSTVMDRLEVELRVGVGIGETTGEAKERFEESLRQKLTGDPWLSEHPPTVRWRAAGFGSAQVPVEHPLVECLADAAEVVFGAPPVPTAVPYSCDMAGWVRLAGAATVLYGPGNVDQAHATNERVSLDATERVSRVLVRTTSALLERDPESLRWAEHPVG